jgi:hypothetical protein
MAIRLDYIKVIAAIILAVIIAEILIWGFPL